MSETTGLDTTPRSEVCVADDMADAIRRLDGATATLRHFQNSPDGVGVHELELVASAVERAAGNLTDILDGLDDTRCATADRIQKLEARVRELEAEARQSPAGQLLILGAMSDCLEAAARVALNSVAEARKAAQ